jgi:PKD repeat protein
MKKILFSLLALVSLAFGNVANAQTPTLVCKLKAKFEYKADKCTIYFHDLSAAATGTTISYWYWQFDDGSTSTLPNPTHTYAVAGTYNVCLTVVGVNAQGVKCKDQFCIPIKVEGCGDTKPCQLYPKFDFKVEKCTVNFIDYSTAGPGTTITNWYWDFDDGTTSTLQNPSHVYATSGTYNVCLVIVGNNGITKCKEQLCLKVTVDGCGNTMPCGVKPLFQFKIDKCTVYFVDQSGTNPGTTITSWNWTFGDGNTSNLQNPVHTYAVAGTYTVCLTTYAKNANGEECKNTYCFPVTVEGCGQVDPCGVKPLFDFKTDKCTVYFVDQTGTNTGTTITNWYWDFDDGNTSSLQNPVHAYTTAGTYNVCLTAYGVNAAGVECKNTYCKKVTVDGCGQIEPCKVAAKFDYKVDGCTVYFADYSATAPGTVITYWEWSFGDGITVTGIQNPSHTYAAPGNYVACLIIVGTNTTTGEQCKDKVCLDITVKDCEPKACAVYPKFDFKVDKCTVYFTDYSAVGPGTIITNWHWEFGDGTTSTLPNPTHTYAAAGTYEVCLTVVGVDATGKQCKDRICIKVDVLNCDTGLFPDKKAADLVEVYPNPAQDLVKIKFKLNTAGQVTIFIADIQGRILDVIQDGQMIAGNHILTWNSNIHPGVYLITIKTDAGIEQKQLLIQE